MSETFTSSYGDLTKRLSAEEMMCDRLDGRWAGRAGGFRLSASAFTGLTLAKVSRQAQAASRTSGKTSQTSGPTTGTTSARNAQPTRPTAPHRPSRRDEIIDAAIAVFAAHGFVDASIAQVAETAGVAVTAVYYHFTSKTDLYEAALTRVLRTVDEIVEAVRADDAPGDQQTLHRTIDAVWAWVDANPGPATLMSLHTPAATRRAAELRHEFDELHVNRAFAYLDRSPAVPASASAAKSAEATMAIRVMIDLLIAIHAMRIEGGPLSAYASADLRKAVKAVSTRLLAVPNERGR
jgi:AcrR family transcriptional regulator